MIHINNNQPKHYLTEINNLTGEPEEIASFSPEFFSKEDVLSCLKQSFDMRHYNLAEVTDELKSQLIVENIDKTIITFRSVNDSLQFKRYIVYFDWTKQNFEGGK